MDLQHIATIKTETGLHEVAVKIDGQPYRFMVRSEREAEIFESKLKAARKLAGQALAYLKEHQMKEEEVKA